jgi:propionyl-CoA synthetase
VGLVVLKDGMDIEYAALEAELIAMIRREIGAVAAFKKAMVVARLPKTRSGKILRKTIRRLAAEEQIITPPTIDDPSILAEIRTALRDHRVGQYANLPIDDEDAEGL